MLIKQIEHQTNRIRKNLIRVKWKERRILLILSWINNYFKMVKFVKIYIYNSRIFLKGCNNSILFIVSFYCVFCDVLKNLLALYTIASLNYVTINMGLYIYRYVRKIRDICLEKKPSTSQCVLRVSRACGTI